MSQTTFGPPKNDADREALARILGQSFNQSPEKILERFPSVGYENLRVLCEGDRVAGGLWMVPMGQWFGGRSVPMTGIAAVGVAPETRGRGVALELMNQTIRDLHQNGTAISTLYPATQTLYRKSGFEQGGSRFLYTIAPKDLDTRDHSLPMREATEADRPAVESAYRNYARRFDGHLDRGPYIWERVYSFRDEPAQGFVIEDGDSILGYAYMLQKSRDMGGYDLFLTDLVATDPRSARTLNGFLSDHRSMSPEASWFGGPANPLFTLLPEQHYEMKLQMIWMTRIISVQAALEARGYPPGLDTELHLEIRDPLIPENDGRFVLTVNGGRGSVRSGGDGRLRTGIRGLTPLFTGFLSPQNLHAIGMLEGEVGDINQAAGIFSGQTPSMSDTF